MTAFTTTRTAGAPLVQAVWERGRHAWALQWELGSRVADGHDGTTHPYKNWHYANRLDWTLQRAAAMIEASASDRRTA